MENEMNSLQELLAEVAATNSATDNVPRASFKT
jgi:hypothetical protein